MTKNTIRVRFDKNGFYHPTFGLLGRGSNKGRVYNLPKEFAEKETIKIPVMDRRTYPPQQIGEREITRFKFLPRTVEIIDDKAWTDAIEEAKANNEKPEEEYTPTVSAEAEVYLEQQGIDPSKFKAKRGTKPQRKATA